MGMIVDAPREVVERPATHPASKRWVLLTGFLLSSMGSGISQIGIGPIIGDVAHTYGISLGAASFAAMGMMIFVMAIGVTISGYLADRIGVLSVLLTAQLAFIVSYLLLPLVAYSFEAFVALRLVQGLAAAGVAGAVTPAIARWFPPNEIGRAMGVQGIGMPVGMLIGLLAVPRLVASIGDWPHALSFLSIAGVIALVPTLYVALRAPLPAMVEAPKAVRRPLADVVRLPAFRYGIIVSILLFVTGFTFNDLAPGFLAVARPVGLGLGSVQAGNFVSLIMWSGLIAPALAGFLVDRVFSGNPKKVMVLGWALTLLPPLVVVPLVHRSSPLLITLFVFGGFAQPIVSIALMSTAARLFAADVVGRVAGMWLSISFFAGAFGTMLGSYALHISGTYLLPIAAVFVGNVLGLLYTTLSGTPLTNAVLEDIQ
jgi:MFS family permease